MRPNTRKVKQTRLFPNLTSHRTRSSRLWAKGLRIRAGDSRIQPGRWQIGEVVAPARKLQDRFRGSWCGHGSTYSAHPKFGVAETRLGIPKVSMCNRSVDELWKYIYLRISPTHGSLPAGPRASGLDLVGTRPTLRVGCFALRRFDDVVPYCGSRGEGGETNIERQCC